MVRYFDRSQIATGATAGADVTRLDGTLSHVNQYQDISMNSRLLGKGGADADETVILRRDASIRNDADDYALDREELRSRGRLADVRRGSDPGTVPGRAERLARKKATAQRNQTMIVAHQRPSPHQMKRLLEQRKAQRAQMQNLGASDQSLQSIRARSRLTYGSNRKGGGSRTLIHDSLSETPVRKGKAAMERGSAGADDDQ